MMHPVTIRYCREGLEFFDPTSDPLEKELSKGKFTILPSKVKKYCFVYIDLFYFYGKFFLSIIISINKDFNFKNLTKERLNIEQNLISEMVV